MKIPRKTCPRMVRARTPRYGIEIRLNLNVGLVARRCVPGANLARLAPPFRLILERSRCPAVLSGSSSNISTSKPAGCWSSSGEVGRKWASWSPAVSGRWSSAPGASKRGSSSASPCSSPSNSSEASTNPFSTSSARCSGEPRRSKAESPSFEAEPD